MIVTLKDAVTIIRKGGVIAYPTETVWGVGCDPWNQEAVKKIINIKGRSPKKGLIILAASIEQIKPLTASLSTEKLHVLSQHYKTPTTWLIPDSQNWVPTWIKGSFDSVAVRITQGHKAKLLSMAFGKPIVSTSANFSQKCVLTDEVLIERHFGHHIQGIVEGGSLEGKNTSTIIDLENKNVIRQ